MTEYTHTAAPINNRAMSKSPTRHAQPSISHQSISNAPSSLISSQLAPHFPPPPRAQQRSFKDLVNRFNQTPDPATQAALHAYSKDRQRRGPDYKPTKLTKPRSPTKSPHGKLQPKRVIPGSRIQTASDTSSTGRPQPMTNAYDSRDFPTSPSKRQKTPLFGEMVLDGPEAFNTGYGIPANRLRRGSEGSNHPSVSSALHTRSQSHANMIQIPSRDGVGPVDKRTHQRSQSDLAADYYRLDTRQHTFDPAFPKFTFNGSNQIHAPARPMNSPTRTKRSNVAEPSSSPVYRRTPSMSNSTNHFPSSSRTSPRKESLLNRKQPSPSPTLTNRRYDPSTKTAGQTGATLRAYINAPLESPKSPPLRSSRPRQPVSTATTTASRARVAERLASNEANGSNDTVIRSRKKKIPELGRMDFAERRARIERAISQNIKEEDRSENGSESTRPSRSNSLLRLNSRTEKNDLAPNMAPGQERLITAQGHDPDTLLEDKSKGPALALDVVNVPVQNLDEPLTDNTDFEIDESPIGTQGELPMVKTTSPQGGATDERPTTPPDSLTPHENGHVTAIESATTIEEETPQSLLSQVMRMRQRSTSSHGTDFAEDSVSSSSHLDDQESINIMLDGESSPAQVNDFWKGQGPAMDEYGGSPNSLDVEELNASMHEAPDVLAEQKTAVEDDTVSVPETPKRVPHMTTNKDIDETPRQHDRTQQPSVFTSINTDFAGDRDKYDVVHRILDEYRQSGSMTPELLHEFQRRVMSMSSDSSKHDNSDAASIRIMLDRMLLDQPQIDPIANHHMETSPEEPHYLTSVAYTAPPRVPVSSERPALQQVVQEESQAPDTSIHDTPLSSKEEGFEEDGRDSEADLDSSAAETPIEDVNPRTAQLPHLPQLRYEPPDTMSGTQLEDEKRPTPPPKDSGYSPRLSATYHTSADIPPSPPSARLSKVSDYQLHLPEFDIGEGLGQGLGLTLDSFSSPRSSVTDSQPRLSVRSSVADSHARSSIAESQPRSSVAESLPPIPRYAPPPVPPSHPAHNHLHVDLKPSGPSRGSVPPTPSSPSNPDNLYQARGGATRPSFDSQQADVFSLPPSVSMSSMDSRLPSMDRSSPATVEEMRPEQKRLTKRRNIIKELVDTEFSYHQDMKIIEDIYKATVGELITAEDKKVLFGNSDQVEAFSLEFYDALRRAVAPYYVPPKSSRWHTKRSSFSTNTSGNEGEGPDDEKDRKTVVGAVFGQYIPRMEKVYGGYLKNHDGANQTLSKLQGDTTVKCWLAECHNNASDITSAWDLDSLLVKPVQRILKYPLLLQQLLESTPTDHPDRESLEKAVKETMNVSHRINEAKKRADLVDQIVNRKRKESDVRTGIAKAFGRRTEKLKERVGIAEAYQDPGFDELAHKFGGHFIRLQVCMRDVQGSLTETDKSVTQFNSFAAALEAYIELGQNSYPEIESKWRKYALAIRELTAVALAEHKAQIKRRVIDPMVMAIKLHEGPQNAITKRKKRLIDFAKCKSIEKKGEKPDKRTIEASEQYEALNEQLKIDLPRLYSLTADLIQACLACHKEIQMDWLWTWEMKLRPVLDEFPPSLASITPSFFADYEIVHAQVLSLALCNGSMLAETANFLSPQSTLVGDDGSSQRRRLEPSDSSRTLSIDSQQSPSFMTPEQQQRSYSGGYTLSPMPSANMPLITNGHVGMNGRVRSSSSLSQQRGRAMSAQGNGPSSTSRMPSLTARPSFSGSRPPTAHNRPVDLVYTPSYTRASVDQGAQHSPRPGSGTSYFTAHQENPSQRYSGMFSSAMPMADQTGSSGPTSPKHAPDETHVMFVAASLFEFNIDRARREAGYPYLTYVQGEVFDVVGQKGELWLAKNQDDATNSLGWIWEQHFVRLSQDS